MFKITLQIRVLRLTLAALLCLFSAGCGVPLRVPTKTRGVSGEEKGSKPDLAFIKVHETTRGEVADKLSWIDTGVKSDRFFLGRWASSGWAEGDPWNRFWSVHNLLVDFDERGVVQKVSYFQDKDLFETLSALTAQDSSGALNLSTPIDVPVEVIDDGFRKRFLGTLTLGKDAIQFLQDRKMGSAKKYMAFKTSPENISHLSLAQTVDDPRKLIETIHFNWKTLVGKQMNVQVDLPTTMTLIRYIAQTRPGS